LAIAWVLKIFCSFLDHRAKTMPDVIEARDLSAELLKEYAVWLVARRRLRRKTAANVYIVSHRAVLPVSQSVFSN